MAPHMKKHEVEAFQEMEAEAVKVAPQYVDSDSATVVDRQVKGDFAYITVQSPNGKKVTVQYDLKTKKPIGYKRLN